MKFSEFEKKDKKEIEAIILKERAKLADFKFKLSLRKVKNTAQIKETRRNIAKAFTAIKEAKKEK